MFALIKTNGATHIAIHIPSDDSCSDSLKQLALMLENNAVFYEESWSRPGVVEPEMTVLLADKVKLDGRSESPEFIVVQPNSAVLDKSFEICTPEVLVSFARQKEKFEESIKRLRNEIETQRFKIKSLERQCDDTVEDLSEPECN
jgi:dynactin complex subunit